MTNYITQVTQNNKFPCSPGPAAVNLNLDFSQATSLTADLSNLVQRGQISDVQALFIDNSQNGNPITIVVNILNQRIVIPAGAQAYMPVLAQQPTFYITTVALGDIVQAFALNFPVMTAVWDVSGSSGGGSSSVNIAEVAGVAVPNTGFLPVNITQVGGASLTLGQKISSNSVPVAFASDQTAAIQNLQSVGGTAVTLGTKAATSSIPVTLASDQLSDVGVFNLVNNSTLNVAVGTTSTNTVITAVTGTLNLTNVGTEVVFVAVGTAAQTATVTTSFPILPNTSITIEGNSVTNVAAIAGATGSTLYITRGT